MENSGAKNVSLRKVFQLICSGSEGGKTGSPLISVCQHSIDDSIIIIIFSVGI